jgi:hypothetical protein
MTIHRVTGPDIGVLAAWLFARRSRASTAPTGPPHP